MSKPRSAKNPVSKKVSLLNEQLARKRGIRSLKKRFLIVCEDTQSACNYFEDLKCFLKLDAMSVRIAHSGGKTQPIQVVEEAIRIKDLAADKESGTEPFSQVWCIIDGDYGHAINNARMCASANGIELAISTMCFEYWILLHFEESASPTAKCDDLLSMIRRKHIQDYDKGKSRFQNIVVNVDDACRRAERLRQPGITRGEQPEDQNPCSEVYKLINLIRDDS